MTSKYNFMVNEINNLLMRLYAIRPHKTKGIENTR